MEAWKSGEPIKNTHKVRHIGYSRCPVVIKKTGSYEDFRKHILYYRKVVRGRIRTPQLLSKDPKSFMIKYQAVGIECDEEGIWSKTLVNFKYAPDKEENIIDFLVRVLEYALKARWTDLHSGNILFDDGCLYLIDYVPGSGRHEIGSFGLRKISADQKVNLVRERFDRLLEMALNKFPGGRVSYCGLDFIRSIDSPGAK